MTRLATSGGNALYLAAQNNGSLLAFQNHGKRFIPLHSDDQWAEIAYGDGRREKVEFYYGSGYLSQASRRLRMSGPVEQVLIYDTEGGKRSFTGVETNAKTGYEERRGTG